MLFLDILLAVIIGTLLGLIVLAFLPHNYRHPKSWIGQHIIYRNTVKWINQGRGREFRPQFPARKWHK